jgi:GT2 family glycosyltransferase
MIYPDVAIVIVTYRSANLTIDCLRSIEAERSAPDVKIRAIVVDAASGDAPAIASAIEASRWSSWVTLVEAPKNGGFGYANNLGIQRAYDDAPPTYVHILNPDTIVRKGGVCELVRFLETHQDVGIAGSGIENSDGSDWPYAFRFPSIIGELERGLELALATRLFRRWVVFRKMSNRAQPVDWVGGASMLVRRKVFDAIGGFDQQYFLYHEETDLCFRARKAGFSTWYVPEGRVMHLGQQSTNAAKPGETPKRLPPYWFKSRCHYFAANHGALYAMATDLIGLIAHSLGHIKRVALQRTEPGIPYFLSDFLKNSTLWPKNRKSAAISQIPHFTHGAKPATQATPAGNAPEPMISAGTR